MPPSSVLQYARRFGLAVDHRVESLDLDMTQLRYSQETRITDTADEYDTAQTGLWDLIQDHKDPLNQYEGKFKLTTCGSKLLFSAISVPDVTPSISHEAWRTFLPEPRRVRKLKLKEPLLVIGGGDVKKDLRRVKRGVDLQGLIQNMIDDWGESAEQSLTTIKAEHDVWSQGVERLAARVCEDIQNEKLQVSRSTIDKLGEIMRCEPVGDLVNEVYETELRARLQAKPNTTPIVLKTDDFSNEVDLGYNSVTKGRCSVDSNQPNEIPNTSGLEEGSYPTISMTVGGIVPITNVTPDVSTCIRPHNEPLSSKSPAKHPRTEDESFFTHNRTPKRRKAGLEPISDSCPSLSSSFQSKPCDREIFVDRSTDTVAADQTLIFEMEQQDNDTAVKDGASSSLANIGGDHHQPVSKAMNRSEPNVFKVAGTTMKLEVLSMDRQEAHMTWCDVTKNDPVSELLIGSVAALEIDEREEAEMNWEAVPVSSTTEVLGEVVEDQTGYLAKVICPPTNITSSAQLLWKESGLRLLDRRDGMNDLVLGSDFEMDEASQKGISDSRSQPILGVGKRCDTSHKYLESHHPTKSSTMIRQHTPSEADNTKFDVLELLPDQGVERGNTQLLTSTPSLLVSSALSDFLDLRGKRFQKPHIPTPCNGELSDDPIQLTPTGQVNNNTPKLMPLSNSPVVASVLANTMPALPLPDIKALPEPRTIIINSALLQSRPSLAMFLEGQSSAGLKLIYRDFDPKVETVPDLILNPTTCLVYTSIQSLTQKLLPGEGKANKLPPTKQHIIKLAGTFDTVLVLITCYIPEGIVPNGTEGITMARFDAFCSSLETSCSRVNILWVLHDQCTALDQAINSWTWSALSQHAFRSQSSLAIGKGIDINICIIEDETLWELFLRRAGLNAMASQVVSGMLQRPTETSPALDQVSEALSAAWGLSQFVRMSNQERIKIFEAIIGERALRTMDEVLERKF